MCYCDVNGPSQKKQHATATEKKNKGVVRNPRQFDLLANRHLVSTLGGGDGYDIGRALRFACFFVLKLSNVGRARGHSMAWLQENPPAAN